MNDEELYKQYHDLFIYKDGNLFWKSKTAPQSHVRIGDEAGTLSSNGYTYIRINKKAFFAHRIIFLMMNRFLPKYIDHIDGDKSNNAIGNLRSCTISQNGSNRGLPKNNTSGLKGVSKSRGNGRWYARICINGLQTNLGSFSSKVEAGECYDNKALEIYGEFAKTNKSMGLL